jgi:HKD family nuclease
MMGAHMVRNHQKNTVQLVLNESDASHSSNLERCLASSTRFVCMTAFARVSGFHTLERPLKRFLAKGNEALFVIGLDFFHTDPLVLNALFKLSGKNSLRLFVSRPSWQDGAPARNFHPKVYIFEGVETHVMIGSANMTGGGLLENHEASLIIHDEWGEISDGIDEQIKQLIEKAEIVAADAAILNEYGRRHAIYKVHERLTKWRVKQALESNDTQNLNLLRGYLVKMKADSTDHGFAADVEWRRDARKESIEKLRDIEKSVNLTASNFLKLYEPLAAGLWHSGGLHRGKNQIAEDAQGFQQALVALRALKSPGIDQAFSTLLRHLKNVNRAGINVLTEILHSLDNRRFAVMNQNSVSGMALAGHTDFPDKPNKNDLNAADYVDFCKKAVSVRDELGLDDFTELDALFNYVYWNHPDE